MIDFNRIFTILFLTIIFFILINTKEDKNMGSEIYKFFKNNKWIKRILRNIGLTKPHNQQKDVVLHINVYAEKKFVGKTPNRPFFSNQHRLEGIAALECVSYTMLNKSKTAVNIIKQLKPDFY